MDLIVTNLVEIAVHRKQYSGVPASLVIDRAEPGIVLVVPYEQQVFHELTGCGDKILACGFVSSSGAENAAAAFRVTLRHLRLRVTPVRVRMRQPGHGPGCSVAKPSRTHSFTALVNHTAPKCVGRAVSTEKLKPGDAVTGGSTSRRRR